MGELAGGGQCDPVHCPLARPIGQVVSGVVAGQADDPPASVLPAESQPVLPDQQPRCPRIDREVQVEALHRGVQQAGVNRLAMAEHQRGDVPQLPLDAVEELSRHRRVAQVRLDSKRSRPMGRHLLPQLFGRTRLHAPLHARVIRSPVREGHVPTGPGQIQYHGRRDPRRTSRPRDQGKRAPRLSHVLSAPHARLTSHDPHPAGPPFTRHPIFPGPATLTPLETRRPSHHKAASPTPGAGHRRGPGSAAAEDCGCQTADTARPRVIRSRAAQLVTRMTILPKAPRARCSYALIASSKA